MLAAKSKGNTSREFENRGPRGTAGPKGEEVTGQ
jgi:hypothetical protein